MLSPHLCWNVVWNKRRMFKKPTSEFCTKVCMSAVVVAYYFSDWERHSERVQRHDHVHERGGRGGGGRRSDNRTRGCHGQRFQEDGLAHPWKCECDRARAVTYRASLASPQFSQCLGLCTADFMPKSAGKCPKCCCACLQCRPWVRRRCITVFRQPSSGSLYPHTASWHVLQERQKMSL